MVLLTRRDSGLRHTLHRSVLCVAELETLEILLIRCLSLEAFSFLMHIRSLLRTFLIERLFVVESLPKLVKIDMWCLISLFLCSIAR